MELDKFLRCLKFSFFLLSSLIIFDPGLVKSGDFKQISNVDKKTEFDYDNVFFQYSTSFENYDSYSNQFDNFFGMNYLDTENKRNFQDLSISIDSKNIRDLYKNMLEQLTIIEEIEIDEEPLYKKKI